MPPGKDDKGMSTEHDMTPEKITEDEVEQMQRVFEKAKRVVKPIVTRELTAEVVTVDLLNIRLRNDYRT